MQLLRQFPPANSPTAFTRTGPSGFGVGHALRNAARYTAVLALLAIGACKESTTESGAIAVVVAPSAVTTTPGAPGVATVNVTRGGSFTGDVTLAAEGLPAGVSAAFAPATLATGVASSSLTLTAGATAVSGTSTVTIRASGSGVTARTTTMQVTVNASSVTLTAGATTATTTQGAAATVALTLQRLGGYTGSVNLAAFGLPANVTANFVPSTLAAGVSNSTLTLAAASNAPVGTSTISVRATGAGIADQIITVQLVITTGAQPDFTLTATPAAVSVAPGGIVTSTIAITRTGGFIDNVGFVTSALPSGVVATFSPNPANLNTTTLSFATTAQATSGTFTITVTGTGGTVASRTVNVMLTVNPQPSITLALSPVTTSVSAGGSVQNTLTVTRLGGFANDVTFGGQNLPNGITLAFSPPTLTGGATTTQATISAAAFVAPGLYTITILANGVGSLVSTSATLNMTVTGQQSFGVAFVSTAASIAAGGTGTLTANITRNGGFAGTINFALSGLPSGITGTVTPSATTGNTATVNLTVGAGTASGTYNGTLNGTATGIASTATNFTVTVTNSGGGGTGNIRWQFCSTTGLPTFFAFKNGANGAWTRVAPNASNLYSFDVTQSVGGVLIVKPNSGAFATTIYLQTRTELETLAANECSSTPTGFKSFTGSVTALSALQTASITMGGGTGSATFGSLNYSLANVLNGAQDLVATRTTLDVMSASFAVDRILIRRNLNLPSGSVIDPLDFTSAEAFDPATGAVTLGGLGSESATLATFFQTQNGGSILLGIPTSGTSTTRNVIGVPTAKLVGTDLHFLLASATSIDLTSVRSVFSYTNQLTAASVSFGAPLDQPTVTSVTSTVSRPRVLGGFQADYQTAIGATLTQANNKSITFSASRDYFGGAGFDLEYPDLTGIQQFDPQWGLSTNTTTNYTITGTNAVAGNIGNGTVFKTASRTGSFISSAIRR